jgi:molecular chaperone DnaK
LKAAAAKLKEAHTAQDIPAIEVALTELNNAWQTASQDMYNASQGGAQQEGAADQNANNNTEDVQDAEVVEEVK